jgi:hypothetical protein
MAKIISIEDSEGNQKLENENLPKRLMEMFSSLDKFSKSFLIYTLLVLLTIPFLVAFRLTLSQQAAGNPITVANSNVYGSGIGMDSLNNTQIGGPYNQSSSYRFRATTSSSIKQFHIYTVGATHAGYGAGTGGTFEATLQSDDGNSNHAPNGISQAKTTFNPGDGLITVTFPTPPSVIAGNLYHIVFRNIDPNPTANYASLDGIFMYEPTTPRQPLVSDIDWGQPIQYGSGAWTDRNNTVPILQVDYSDGTTSGIGYMETWVRSYKSISGSMMARENFTPSSDQNVSSFSVRLMRISGTSPLKIRLEKADGTLVEEGNINSTNIPIGTPGDHGGTGHATWVTYNFTNSNTLAVGQNYNVVLSTTADTTYSIFVIRKGVDYAYSKSTYFSDGHAQYNNGSGWTAFTQDGAGILDEGDLQFYFTTNTATKKSAAVSSIADLKTKLADNTLDEIVVANGTYHVSAAGNQAADSLWIGASYANRTRPITVKAQTPGGVTFDGGGTTYYGCLWFEDGAHNQTWDGFNCSGGEATMTGIIVFGGYAGKPAPHHITMRNIKILSTCTGNATSGSSPANDHGIYISQAVGGPHDLLFEDITVDGSGGLASAFHFYHSDSANQNGSNITVNRLHVKGTQQAIMLWDSTLKNITFNTADITNPFSFAARYETTGATNILLENITSTKGFYSSQGTSPAGVTLLNNQFNLSSMPSGVSNPTPTPTTLTNTPTPTPLPPTPTPTLKPTATPMPINTPTPKPTATPTPSMAPTSMPLTPTPTQALPTPTPGNYATPQVNITYPSNFSFVKRNRITTIQATTSDNSKIKNIDFYVNGKLVCSDSSYPFSCNWYVGRYKFAIYTITAYAFDYNGNFTSYTITDFPNWSF